jgi:F-type H+-transporting ATPase subunit epsilon
MASLNVAVVSVDQNIWSGEAKSLIAKTTEGEIGILAGHEPVLSLLVDGVVRVEAADGSKVEVNISGGFLAVDNNSVRVLAEGAQVL